MCSNQANWLPVHIPNLPLKQKAFRCLTELQFTLSYSEVKFSVRVGLMLHSWYTVNSHSYSFECLFPFKKANPSSKKKLSNEEKEKVVFTICVRRIAQPKRERFSTELTRPTPSIGIYRHIRGLNSHFSKQRSTQYKSTSSGSKADCWPAESLPS